MKAVLLLLALGLLSCVRPANAQACFTDQKVVKVNVGYVYDGHLGPDAGDAVYFTLDDGKTYALNKNYNLDWSVGRLLFRTLLVGFVTGFRVTGYDHYGNNCDDIDQIGLRR